MLELYNGYLSDIVKYDYIIGSEEDTYDIIVYNVDGLIYFEKDIYKNIKYTVKGEQNVIWYIRSMNEMCKNLNKRREENGKI